MKDYVGEALGTTEGLEIICLADVTPRKIDWLWENWLAIGKVSVLAGDGGKGKSTILCDWAARTSNGENWPDGAAASSPGGVIILAAEDDVEDTLLPRLIAAGANLSDICTIRSVRNGDARRSFNLQADLAKLEVEIQKRGNIRLVIIDPISSYLGKVDSHKNSEVRSVLEPLGEMAARLRVAVVCNNHFSKSGGNANSKIIGSVAFVNQARAAFIVTPDAEDETQTRLLLMPSKMNIAPVKHGLAYRIEGRYIAAGTDEIFTSNILWEATPVTITADQALAAHAEDPEDRTEESVAVDFLRDRLRGGPVPTKEVQDDAKGLGVATRTLFRARKKLRVIAEKDGLKGGWTLRLPPEECQPIPKNATFKTWQPSASNGSLPATPPKPSPPTESTEDAWTIPEYLDRRPRIGPPTLGPAGDDLGDL
jgi:putative DNA primase/helicase